MSLAMYLMLSQTAPHINTVTLKARSIERIWVQLSPKLPRLITTWSSAAIVLTDFIENRLSRKKLLDFYTHMASLKITLSNLYKSSKQTPL